uniref:Uncharacterized protein n=1 Tax=Panagrellus redivivus TaxID=6233 RepID=A0A7E4WBS0_PANRE
MGHNLVAIRSISRRFRRACFVPVNAKVDGCKNTICNENYKNGVLETDESSAREVLITLIATFIVTLLWNGMCLAIIIKVCQAARNKRKGCSPLLPMDADTDAQDADITVKKTTKPRWGPETTRANYCYLVALTFCLMKLFVRQ